jgi:hypothetical protein
MGAESPLLLAQHDYLPDGHTLWISTRRFMKTRVFEAVAVLALILPTVGRLASTSQSYDYKIIAQRQTPINGWVPLSIKSNPKINNNGHLAFIAT